MTQLTARTAASVFLTMAMAAAATLAQAAPKTPFMTKIAGVPAVVKPGASVTVKLTVIETATVPNGVVDMQVFDGAKNSVVQKYTQNATVTKGKPQTYVYTFAAPKKPGVYSIKVGVFNQNWKTLMSWNDTAATMKVS